MVRVTAALQLAAFCVLLGARALAAAAYTTSRVTIDNHDPRRDTEGIILNSHDGSLLEHNGTFYKYGTVQPNCIGSSRCKVGVSAADLSYFNVPYSTRLVVRVRVLPM